MCQDQVGGSLAATGGAETPELDVYARQALQQPRRTPSTLHTFCGLDALSPALYPARGGTCGIFKDVEDLLATRVMEQEAKSY